MADDDAASGEDLIDRTQAQRKVVTQPHGEADDLDVKAKAGIAVRGWRCRQVWLRNQVDLGKGISLQSWPLKLTVLPPLRTEQAASWSA